VTQQRVEPSGDLEPEGRRRGFLQKRATNHRRCRVQLGEVGQRRDDVHELSSIIPSAPRSARTSAVSIAS
jgi:hypothetical protein